MTKVIEKNAAEILILIVLIFVMSSCQTVREMISNLRLFKNSDKVSSLTDNTEIELTKYEMLLENH